MPTITIDLWVLLIPFVVIFVSSFIILNNLSKKFRLKGPENKTFSIFALEFPGSDEKLSTLIENMTDKAKKNVRLNLIVDYIFMLGVYPAISILCFIAAKAVGDQSAEFGSYALKALGWAQIIPFLCDFVENQILLYKLRKPRPVRPDLYLWLKWLVGIKFGLAILAITSTLFSFLFLWFIGKSSMGVTIGIAVITLFIIAYFIYCEIQCGLQRRKEEAAKLKKALKAMEATSN